MPLTLIAGQIVVYADEMNTWMWRLGNDTVLIIDNETLEQVDCFTWAEQPSTIIDAINMASARAVRIDEY